MVSEPVKDELSMVYGEPEERQSPQSVTAGKDTRIGEIQTNMLSQVTEMKQNEFTLVTHKKLKSRKAGSSLKKEDKRSVPYANNKGKNQSKY